jgi:RNA polymerase sigma-70 factor (ECF subfamily)
MRDPPDRNALRSLHNRLLFGDRLASEELSCLLLPLLSEEIRRRIPKTDVQIISDGVIDAVLEYCANPQHFNAAKDVPLDRFLATAAWRNVDNLVLGERRRKQRERSVGRKKREADVAFDPPARKIKQEEEDEVDRRCAAMFDACTDPIDKEVLRLKLDGVRETAAFAEVLNLTHLPVAKQQEEVKRHKDRISRFLRRKGLLP